MEEKQYNEKEISEIVNKVYSKTLAADMEPCPFEKMGQLLKSIIERCTKGKYTTNGANGLTCAIEVFEK